MTPETLIARLDAAIAQYGQTVTIQRTTTDATGASTVSEITCAASVRPSGPQDVEAAGVVPIRVIVSPTGLGTFVPQPHDLILIDGDAADIQQIAPLTFGGRVVRVNMLCRG